MRTAILQGLCNHTFGGSGFNNLKQGLQLVSDVTGFIASDCSYQLPAHLGLTNHCTELIFQFTDSSTLFPFMVIIDYFLALPDRYFMGADKLMLKIIYR